MNEIERRLDEAKKELEQVSKRLTSVAGALRQGVITGKFPDTHVESRLLSDAEVEEQLTREKNELFARTQVLQERVNHYTAMLRQPPRMQEIFLEQEKNRQRAQGGGLAQPDQCSRRPKRGANRS